MKKFKIVLFKGAEEKTIEKNAVIDLEAAKIAIKEHHGYAIKRISEVR